MGMRGDSLAWDLELVRRATLPAQPRLFVVVVTWQILDVSVSPATAGVIHRGACVEIVDSERDSRDPAAAKILPDDVVVKATFASYDCGPASDRESFVFAVHQLRFLRRIGVNLHDGLARISDVVPN